MSGNEGQTVYIRLRKFVQIKPAAEVPLYQVAEWLADSDADVRLRELTVPAPSYAAGEGAFVLDWLDVVARIRQALPRVQLEQVGDPQVVVQWEPSAVKPPRKWLIVLVWLLLFAGSGLAIMNFHADVSMPEVHRKLYWYITGEWREFPLLMQIPYSFGLGLGMVLFFNRFLRKKLNREPDPLELEMFHYQQGIQQFRVTEALRDRPEQEDIGGDARGSR